MSRVILLVHLLAFAAYLGAGFGQLRLMNRSRAAGVAAAARDELERLSAIVITRIELPAIFVSVLSGAASIAMTPALMREGWLHGKLACVAVLLVLSHVEMFNARAIVKLRAAAGSDAEIDARKRRHAIYGAVGSLLVAVLLALVVFVR